MTANEIDAAVRLMVLEERARKISPADLTFARTEAINSLANLLVAAAPEYFEKKVSLQAKETNINRFELPGDCLGLKGVWDLDDNAGSVTAAADNGSGAIRLTIASHGFSDEDCVIVHDIAGTTEANGKWQIDYITANTFDLVGSVFTNAWTSGGKVFKDCSDTYRYPIDPTPSKFQDASDESHYFLNEDDIVIDDPEFESDLVVLYRYLPTILSEIPARMHFGIWAYGAILLIQIPAPQVRVGGEMDYHPEYNTYKKNLALCQGLWQKAQAMAMQFRPVLASNNISKVKAVNQWL